MNVGFLPDPFRRWQRLLNFRGHQTIQTHPHIQIEIVILVVLISIVKREGVFSFFIHPATSGCGLIVVLGIHEGVDVSFRHKVRVASERRRRR